jgi:hypothetical protein
MQKMLHAPAPCAASRGAGASRRARPARAVRGVLGACGPPGAQAWPGTARMLDRSHEVWRDAPGVGGIGGSKQPSDATEECAACRGLRRELRQRVERDCAAFEDLGAHLPLLAPPSEGAGKCVCRRIETALIQQRDRERVVPLEPKTESTTARARPALWAG